MASPVPVVAPRLPLPHPIKSSTIPIPISPPLVPISDPIGIPKSDPISPSNPGTIPILPITPGTIPVVSHIPAVPGTLRSRGRPPKYTTDLERALARRDTHVKAVSKPFVETVEQLRKDLDDVRNELYIQSVRINKLFQLLDNSLLRDWQH